MPGPGSMSGPSLSPAPLTPDKSRFRSSAGFTLVELLVVLVILGLLAGLAGPRVFGVLGQSRQQAARIQLEQLATALDLYYLDFGRFPSAASGLEALVKPPAGENRGRGGYLNRPALPLDPWGNPYHYRVSGQNNGYEVFSLGADGQEGGEGDNRDVRLTR